VTVTRFGAPTVHVPPVGQESVATAASRPEVIVYAFVNDAMVAVSGRDHAVTVSAQQARGDKIADRTGEGVDFREVLVADEHLAAQLVDAESLGVQQQDAREHGELPGRVRKLRLG
jgi:hypothetical protein